MADPTYNCPFSTNSYSTPNVLTCAQLMALNSNARCALFDSVDEQCMVRQWLLKYKGLWRGSVP